MSSGKTVFFKDKLFAELKSDLVGTISDLVKLKEILAEYFPNYPWSAQLVWVLLQENCDLKSFMRESMIQREAVKMGLDLGLYVKDNEKTPEHTLSRKIVTSTIFDKLSNLHSFTAKNRKSLTTYLRLGVIAIEGDEIICKPSKDVEALLTDYCSVTIENSSEGEFYDTVVAMQKNLAEMSRLAATINDTHERLNGSYKMKLRNVRDVVSFSAYHFTLDGSLRLQNENTPWRALISYVLLKRKNDAPRFFNNAGVMKTGIECMYQLTGYLPQATPHLQFLFPKLYGVNLPSYEDLEKKIEKNREKYGLLYNLSGVDFEVFNNARGKNYDEWGRIVPEPNFFSTGEVKVNSDYTQTTTESID